jgi:hypothetical protein
MVFINCDAPGRVQIFQTAQGEQGVGVPNFQLPNLLEVRQALGLLSDLCAPRDGEHVGYGADGVPLGSQCVSKGVVLATPSIHGSRGPPIVVMEASQNRYGHDIPASRTAIVQAVRYFGTSRPHQMGVIRLSRAGRSRLTRRYCWVTLGPSELYALLSEVLSWLAVGLMNPTIQQRTHTGAAMRSQLFTLIGLLCAVALSGCLTLGGFAKAENSDLYVLTTPKPLGSGSVMVCDASGSCTEYVSADVMKGAGIAGLGHSLYALEALPGDQGVLVAAGSAMDAGKLWHCTSGQCQELAGITGLAGLGGQLEGNADGLSGLLDRRAEEPTPPARVTPTIVPEEPETTDE